MKEESELKTATQLITEERERQISKEGWTIEHDDQHIHGELAKAADCYYEYAEDNDYTDKRVHQYWPWDKNWWKPKDQLRDYIRAGALYRAEKERLERTGGAVGPKLTNLRIGIRQCEIRIDEILAHEAYCAKKDRPTPPVETKTAEEILIGYGLEKQIYIHRNDVISICENYHAQFTAKSVEVEEAFYWHDFDEKFKCLVDNIHLAVKNAGWKDFYYQVLKYQDKMIDSGYKMIDGCSDDYKKLSRQQQKQADTISQLTESLKTIYSLAKPGSAIYDICDKTLNPKK